MGCEWLIEDNRVLISLIASSMNYETAVTFTHGHFNKVVFAVKGVCEYCKVSYYGEML